MLLREIQAAVGAPGIAAQTAGGQIYRGRAIGFEIDPADVRAVGVAAQVAEAVLVSPQSRCRKDFDNKCR